MKHDKKNQSNSIKGEHLNDEATALYVDALLREEVLELPEDILNHVQVCFECKEKIMDVYTILESEERDESVIEIIKDDVREREVVSAVPTWRQEWGTNIFQMVAFLFLIVLPVALSVFIGQKNKEANELNSTLEYFIDSRTRSAELGILSPKPNQRFFGKEIVFAWENVTTDSLTIKVLDNHGNLIYLLCPEGNRAVLSNELSYGLYYWKLETEEDLLYLGKFYFRKR